MKRLIVIPLFLTAALALFAKGSADKKPAADSPQAAPPAALTVYGLKGPSGVALIKLFETPPALPGFTVTVEALAAADQMAARFISGEAQAGILPPNVAAKIASSGKDIRAAAVIGTGMLSLLSADPAVSGLASLRGKTIAVAGQGATPDFVLRKILLNAGLDPAKDVKLDYSLATPEIVQSLAAGRVATAILPEPFATMASGGAAGAGRALRPVCDVQAEWVKAGGEGNYPMTLLVVSGAFADSHPEALAALLEAVKASVGFVTSDPAGAGALVEQFDLGLKAAVVKAAVPKSGYVFIPAKEARPALESLYKVFLQFAPASVGGALPGDAFYE